MQVSGIEFPVIFCENIEKSLYMWEFCDKLSNTKNNVFVNTCEGVDEYEARTRIRYVAHFISQTWQIRNFI